MTAPVTAALITQEYLRTHDGAVVGNLDASDFAILGGILAIFAVWLIWLMRDK